MNIKKLCLLQFALPIAGNEKAFFLFFSYKEEKDISKPKIKEKSLLLFSAVFRWIGWNLGREKNWHRIFMKMPMSAHASQCSGLG